METTTELIDPRIAGALFDFLGYLTTLPTPLTVGATHDAPPALHALWDWAKERGLNLDEADVKGWRQRRERDAARAKVARCREALESVRINWANDFYACPFCGETGTRHDDSCAMTAVLDVLATAEEGTQ